MSDPREEAVRLARRMPDPAAVCAAIAVFRSRAEDEARGRALGERMVEGGLLTADQLAWLFGGQAPSWKGVPAPSIPIEAPHPAFEPASAAVAVLEAPDEPPPRVLVPPEEPAEPVLPVPAPAIVGSARTLGAGVAPPHESVPDALPRWLLVAACLLGVSLAVVVWLLIDGGSPSVEAPQRVAETRPAAVAPPSAAPVTPPPVVVASVPLPPPPPRWLAVPWPPQLRQVREGDSPQVREGLRGLERELSRAAEPEPISFDVRRSLARQRQVDRLAAWVELNLGHFADVAGLRTALDCPSERVDIAWIGE